MQLTYLYYGLSALWFFLIIYGHAIHQDRKFKALKGITVTGILVIATQLGPTNVGYWYAAVILGIYVIYCFLSLGFTDN